MKYLLALFALLFFTACATTTVNNGLVVTSAINPVDPFTNSYTDFTVDMENTDVKNIYNLQVNVFDKGTLTGECDPYKQDEFMSGQFHTYDCRLRTPEKIPEARTETTVSAAVTFEARLETVQLIELISETEYNANRRNIAQKSDYYAYGDKNLLVEVRFSEPLPIVVRPNKRDFITIQIRNIGNGFVGDLKPDQIKIAPVMKQPDSSSYLDIIADYFQSKIYTCSTEGTNAQTLRAVDKTFPQITCELQLPENVNYIENYGMRIIIDYNYEVRVSQPVTIVR